MLREKKIVLENGREFFGYSFGAEKEIVSEIVFNTSMVGYQEVFSDLSYAGQMVVMTYPLIGNYGVNDEDNEAKQPMMGGLIVREYNDSPSNFRYTKTLSEAMEECGIPGIAGVDTRELTRIIRDEGSQKVLLTDIEIPTELALERMKTWQFPADMVAQVSCKKRWYSRTHNHKYNVAILDCGIKLSIVQQMNKLGCNVTVLPYNTTAEEILALAPDGLFISNGPGNPMDVLPVINTVKNLKGKLPIYGIGLGHQLIALSFGAKTYKMKFGHRGGNHPVKNVRTNKIEIVGQNHSYAVDKESLENTKLNLTHVNLLDDTVEGFMTEDCMIMAVQYDPGNADEIENKNSLFATFLSMMGNGGAENA